MNLTHFELKKPRGASWHFVIPGEPVACERPRVTKFGTYLPKKTRDAEEAIGWTARASFPKARPSESALFGLRVKFFLAGHQRRDTDNFLKTLLDGTKGIFFSDDSQVREVYAVIVPNHRARTEVFFYELEADYLAAAGEDL